MSSLISAAKSSDLTQLIKTVMRGNVNVNEQDEHGRTALHYACMRPYRPLLRYLLSRSELDTNIKDETGKTALQCAPKEALQYLTVAFSKAQEKMLKKEGRAREGGAKRGENENNEMMEEEEDKLEEANYVSPTTFRKLLICIILPLLYLFLRNGFMFSIVFITCSLAFYTISLAYFVSEVAVRPPWYHHQPKATHLVMKNCPDYWQGWINDPKTDFGLDYESVEFPSTDGYTLRGWYVPPPRATAASFTAEPLSPFKRGRSGELSKPGPERDLGLVLVHGAGRDRRAWERHIPFLHKAGYGCLLFDMREHGLSDGKMRGVTYGMRERYDVISACGFLRTQYGYSRVGIIGTSVGGASVIMAAGIDKSIDVVIAENAMTTSATMFNQQIMGVMGGYFSHHTYSVFFFKVFRKLCTMWLNVRIGNTPTKHCQALHCIDRISPRPILLMHGTVDSIVPCKHSRILYDAAKEPKQLYMCENAFHCGLYNINPEAYEETVLGFLGKYSTPVDPIAAAVELNERAKSAVAEAQEAMGKAAEDTKEKAAEEKKQD